MTDLTPCPACRRHVRAADAACPFCGAAAEPLAPRFLPRGRWSRAAVFAAGATLAACGGKKDETPATGSAPGSGSAAGSAGSAPMSAPADAAVTADAATPDAAPVDAGTPDAAPAHKKKHHKVDHHAMPKPYGAPPARRRIV